MLNIEGCRQTLLSIGINAKCLSLPSKYQCPSNINFFLHLLNLFIYSSLSNTHTSKKFAYCIVLLDKNKDTEQIWRDHYSKKAFFLPKFPFILKYSLPKWEPWILLHLSKIFIFTFFFLKLPLPNLQRIMHQTFNV